MRRLAWVGVFLFIPAIAWSAPQVYDQVWGDQIEARLDALEAEVFPTTTLPTVTLTEDLVITSDTTLTGHIEGNGFQILIDGADVTMTNLTVNNVSRIQWHNACGVAQLNNVTITNSGTGELGFYPLHWHLCGDTTRGTLVENVTVEDSNNRAYVPHGSNGITFLSIEAHRTTGQPFWWDKGQGINDSHDIVVDGAFFDTVLSGRDKINDANHHRNAGFVLRGGTGNVVRNSTVLNVSGGSSCSGFHWAEGAGNPSAWTFQNNHSVSESCDGIFVWQNGPEVHLTEGFTGGQIDHGAYKNGYVYEGVNVSGVLAHALGWSMSNSQAGDFTAVGHHSSAAGERITFTNTTFASFTINNGGGNAPGVYELNGSNLFCANIIYLSVFPGTQVIIDGVEC